VIGAKTFACPECAADLRAVGIATPRFRHTAGRRSFLLAWTGVCLVPAVLMMLVAGERGLLEFTWLETHDKQEPGSAKYEQVAVEVTFSSQCWMFAETYFGFASPGNLKYERVQGKVHLKRPPHEVVTLTVEWPASTWVIDAPKVGASETGSDFDKEAVGRLFRAAGLDPVADERQDAEVDAVFEALTKPIHARSGSTYRSGPVNLYNPFGTVKFKAEYGDEGPVWWWLALVAAALAGGWMIGALLLGRWRRRVMARVALAIAEGGGGCP
jgi:hypothetical protein